MIKHFLKRDFDDCYIYWFVVIIVAVLALVIGPLLTRKEFLVLWGVLAYIYFIIGIFPLTHVLGSQWRSQHYLSRFYLLALPVSRLELFNIQQIRILFFMVPFIFVMLALPLVFLFSQFVVLSPVCLVWGIVYFLLFFISIMLYLQGIISAVLASERISRKVDKSDRFFAQLKSSGLAIIYLFIVVSSWTTFFEMVTKNQTILFPLVGIIVMSSIVIYLLKNNFMYWSGKESKSHTFTIDFNPN